MKPRVKPRVKRRGEVGEGVKEAKATKDVLSLKASPSTSLLKTTVTLYLADK